MSDLFVATEESLSICDIRASWTAKKFIEDVHGKNIGNIKFDPFDNNRFAAQTKESIKVFDLRNRRRPLFNLKVNQKSSFAGFVWS